jgi:peptidoglycan/xylan/chitin deacetylase (PgdA/CDA1 family)
MRLFQNPVFSFVAVPAFSLLLVSQAASAPVTTVPWNGKTGAVSFTYDDARTSQIPYLIPQLDSLGIKATFFISIQTIGDFNARRAAWIQAARNGQELTNHTYNHANVNGSDGAAVTTMIKSMADTLRSIDTTIQSVTFAYPNCNLTANATAKNGISAENFMARGCANPTLNWGTQPSDWMNIQGEILGPTSASSAVSRINTAKTNNRWYITILHDVTPTSPDQYSMTPANNRTMLEAAVSAGVWIDTYERIGSYYRAHFTIDTAKAVVNGNGWKVEWVSPHARMPKRVLLRVKLDKTVFGDSAVVVQNGVEIPLQSDTAYVVDFMKLRLDVYPKGTVAVSPASRFRNATLEAKVSGRVLRLRGLPAGNYIVAVHGVTGALVDQGRLRATGVAEQAVSLRTTPRPGRYQITLTPTNRTTGGAARKLSVLVLP